MKWRESHPNKPGLVTEFMSRSRNPFMENGISDDFLNVIYNS